jgi:CheY-like chemotaxis protein
MTLYQFRLSRHHRETGLMRGAGFSSRSWSPAELIRRLRALGPDQGGRLPAIAVTAHASAHDAATTLAAGFDRHLAKPVRAADLVTAVAELAGVAKIAKLDG